MTSQPDLPVLDLDDPSLKPKVDYTSTDVHHGHADSDVHHHHQDKPTVDYVEENKKYFNKIAAHNHDDARWVLLAKTSAAEMLKRYKFDKDKTVVLDFACNAGLIAREILPFSKKIIGVDISEGAINVFNDWVLQQGISSEKMHGIVAELKGEEGELGGEKFDVITCAASYHHFEDINKITKMLSFFLKPGGVLLVTDRVTEQEKLTSDALDNIMAHKHGISKEDIEEAFSGAGLSAITFEHFTRAKIMGNNSILFIATASLGNRLIAE